MVGDSLSERPIRQAEGGKLCDVIISFTRSKKEADFFEQFSLGCVNCDVDQYSSAHRGGGAG